ncbi:coiled-coil domain-containing protein, partial [Wolbachia endosymbiont of Culex molestus]
MFVGKESNSSGWKQWGIGLVDKTLSSVDQAISGWFWNLINDLPRDYFAKTFDQVNYFDQSVWEGIFRARIEDIKEQLESGVSKKAFEADIIKLQGLIGKHSLSPLVYEDGLKELEDFVSDSSNPGKYLQLLANVRNEFREELRAQPLLLKECIKNDTNLGRREVAYYQSLLDSTSNREIPIKPSALGKSIVSKNGVTNSKLRNISKLLFCNPAQAVTLFLAGQVAFANAVSIQLNNSSAVENSTLPFEDKLFNISKVKEDLRSNVSTYNALDEATTLKNVSELRLEEEKVDDVEEILANSTLLPFNNNITGMDEVAEKVMISPSSEFADIPESKVEELDVSNLNCTSTNHMSLLNKVQMENATLEVVEEHKTLAQPQFEPDYPRNSTLPFDNMFISVRETKDNSTTSLDTFAEDTVIKNDKHFLSANSTFEVEESVIVNTEKSSYSLFTKAFNDEIEKVKNEINKLIIALTQTELDESTKVDVRRSKRSISTNSSIIDNPNPSGSFTRSNPSSKVAKLENEMRKMKEDIAQLKQSSTTSSEDKVRLGNLETTVETLQKLLDDQSKEFTQKVANLESLVESLINVVNGFRKELDDMKKKAAEQETIQKQKGLPAECVEAIKSHNFKAAEEKLQEINDDSKINLIIKEAYNYQISNFDLVLKFGDSVRNIKRSFLTYKALNYEMESNGHKDPFKMIKLIESLRKEIINQLNTSSEIKGEAEFLASSLKDSVKAVAKEKLKDGMLY